MKRIVTLSLEPHRITNSLSEFSDRRDLMVYVAAFSLWEHYYPCPHHRNANISLA